MNVAILRCAMLATLGTAAVLPSVASAQLIAQKYFLTRRPAAINIEAGQTFGVDPNGISSTVFNQGMLNIGFEGISQYDVAAVGRNFIPPDTIGAAGRTQYVQFTNGGFAVYDKATGTRSLFSSDTAFWQAAGQAGVPNGDQRVIFSPQANKFIAISFGSNTKDILVAVSDTGNALGTWKSTKFEGFAELTPGGRTLADYPTLAFDNNAVYIGTNDFAAATVGGPTNFRGTTLNVIPLSDILGAGGPNRSGLGPDGRITLAARTFRTNAFGQLISTGDEIVLRISDTDDYHNGSLYGQAAAGRQRWADYATVTLDPMSVHSFWISGTFAREYNLGAFGHPGGTGGSRWGTYIAELNVGGVPEPQSWAMLIIGFGLIGAVNRRQRQRASC